MDLMCSQLISYCLFLLLLLQNRVQTACVEQRIDTNQSVEVARLLFAKVYAEAQRRLNEWPQSISASYGPLACLPDRVLNGHLQYTLRDNDRTDHIASDRHVSRGSGPNTSHWKLIDNQDNSEFIANRGQNNANCGYKETVSQRFDRFVSHEQGKPAHNLANERLAGVVDRIGVHTSDGRRRDRYNKSCLWPLQNTTLSCNQIRIRWVARVDRYAIDFAFESKCAATFGCCFCCFLFDGVSQLLPLKKVAKEEYQSRVNSLYQDYERAKTNFSNNGEGNSNRKPYFDDPFGPIRFYANGTLVSSSSALH